MMPKPEAKDGKSHEVAARLEDEILRSGLRPGWRLPSEEQLCQTYSVSRTVVREAIQQLKSRGIVTSRRGGGTYVAPVDEECVRIAMRAYARLSDEKAFDDLLEFRVQIESATAAAMARRRDKDAVARLKVAMEELRRCKDIRDKFSEADLAFHRVMAEESGNALYTAILASFFDLLADYSKESHRITELRDRVIADHDAIFEAIRSGNVEAARELAGAHVRLVTSAYAEVRRERTGAV